MRLEVPMADSDLTGSEYSPSCATRQVVHNRPHKGEVQKDKRPRPRGRRGQSLAWFPRSPAGRVRPQAPRACSVQPPRLAEEWRLLPVLRLCRLPCCVMAAKTADSSGHSIPRGRTQACALSLSGLAAALDHDGINSWVFHTSTGRISLREFQPQN